MLHAGSYGEEVDLLAPNTLPLPWSRLRGTD